jgi:thiamine pyrophosphate-dependent acetolactate synthase large subunit-like protein
VPETAQETGADAFVRALPEHGVEVMFGLPPARTRSLRRWPDEHDVRAAVALIAAAERPILVLGSDAAGASEDARALANELELPVFTAERSQLAELPFPARDPHNFAQYGEHPQLIADSDCVVAIGMRVFQPFSSSHTLRLPAAATFIHAHAEPEYVGWNVEPDVGLAADPQPAPRALLEEASHNGISVATRSAREARLDAMRKAFADDIARDRARYAGAGPG